MKPTSSKTLLEPGQAWSDLKVRKLRKQIINNTSVSLMSYYLGMPEMAIRSKAEEENLSLTFCDNEWIWE